MDRVADFESEGCRFESYRALDTTVATTLIVSRNKPRSYFGKSGQVREETAHPDSLGTRPKIATSLVPAWATCMTVPFSALIYQA